MSDPERLNEAIDAMLQGKSPREHVAGLDAEDEKLLLMAQMIRGLRQEDPDAGFAQRVIAFGADRKRLSRRTAFVSGLGAMAAGIAAAVGLGHLLDRPARQPAALPKTLHPTSGVWHRVANVADVPEGSVMAFTAGPVQGFLINRGGNLHALSRICTHMQCVLHFNGSEQALVCPCHGARFSMQGSLESGPGGRYSVPLAPLPRIATRVRDGSIEVLSV